MKYLSVYKQLYKKDNFFIYCYRYFFDNTFKCNILFNKINKTNNKLKKNRLINRMQKKYSVIIGPNSEIGSNVILKHPIGIVIGDKVKIDDNVIIYQNVTIGKKNNGYPHICSNTIIYPNSVIIGDIRIGKEVKIGASCFIDFDINDKETYASNRAINISKKEDD